MAEASSSSSATDSESLWSDELLEVIVGGFVRCFVGEGGDGDGIGTFA